MVKDGACQIERLLRHIGTGLAKSRSLRGLLEYTKKNWGSQLAINLNKNADISVFLKKEKDTSSRISLEFDFTYRKADTFKLLGKGKIKKKYFNDNIVATALLASLTPFLWLS